MKRIWMVLVMVGFVAGLAGSAGADEVAELRKQMEQQYEQMRQMQNRLIALEQAQTEQGQTIQKIENEGLSIPESMAWVENVKLYGDFRYRYEYRDSDWKSSTSDRHRIRARVGVKAKINDEFTFDFRIATAEFLDDDNDDKIVSGDSVSGNKTLGEYWATKNAWIDRAYVAYKPHYAEDLTMLFGKMGNPFYKVGKNQLIWDGDVNPEGIAFQYETGDLFVNGMLGYVQENGSSSDKTLLGIQAGLAHAFEDSSKLTYGASYYDYSNVKGESLPEIGGDVIDGGVAGNTSTDGLTYDYDYNLLEGFAEYAFKLGELPLSLYGDYVVNTASGVDEDTGWLVGTTINKAKKPGSWQFGYTYRDLEADAVLGAFTDSDFGRDGGTNVRGHTFNYTYALAKNTTIGATYFMDEKLSEKPDEDNKRLQVDLKVKF